MKLRTSLKSLLGLVFSLALLIVSSVMAKTTPLKKLSTNRTALALEGEYLLKSCKGSGLENRSFFTATNLQVEIKFDDLTQSLAGNLAREVLFSISGINQKANPSISIRQNLHTGEFERTRRITNSTLLAHKDNEYELSNSVLNQTCTAGMLNHCSGVFITHSVERTVVRLFTPKPTPDSTQQQSAEIQLRHARRIGKALDFDYTCRLVRKSQGMRSDTRIATEK